ncbi:hypothetical protein N431DRAFT_69391 [Stipitochalara longipes BDJ]|nr:hypothetical protein N431DRAFT_69391 [Stipitochalara longipes BDJ]
MLPNTAIPLFYSSLILGFFSLCLALIPTSGFLSLLISFSSLLYSQYPLHSHLLSFTRLSIYSI